MNKIRQGALISSPRYCSSDSLERIRWKTKFSVYFKEIMNNKICQDLLRFSTSTQKTRFQVDPPVAAMTIQGTGIYFAQPNSIPPPGFGKDLIVPRADNAMIKRAVNRIIDYSFNPFTAPFSSILRKLKVYQRDVNVSAVIAREEQFSKLLGCTVSLYSRTVSGKDQTYHYASGSGILMSPNGVFTCSHTFDPIEGLRMEDIFVSKDPLDLNNLKPDNLFEATIIPMNEYFDVEEELDPMMKFISDPYFDEWPFGENCIDFAVLKLKDPMPFPEHGFLSLADKVLDQGEPLILSGFPDAKVGSEDISKAYPGLYLNQIYAEVRKSRIRINEEQIRDLLESFFNHSFFDFKDFVVCFGESSAIQDEGMKYRTANFSVCDGLSGGPVISANTPDQLQGLAVGGFQKYPKNIFISVSHPAIQAAYHKYVL